jgi:hypothetical protein
MVNGANVEEGKSRGTSIVPNLDAISEIRNIHGSALEFLRNTDLDAREIFSTRASAPTQAAARGTESRTKRSAEDEAE